MDDADEGGEEGGHGARRVFRGGERVERYAARQPKRSTTARFRSIHTAMRSRVVR